MFDCSLRSALVIVLSTGVCLMLFPTSFVARPILSLASLTFCRHLSMTSATVTPFSMVFVTAPNQEVAKKLAGGLVSEKLAACVNIIPSIVSIYEWEGKINTDEEVLMMIKTRTETIADLTAYVTQNHPYDVVEVISTSIEHGNQPYLDWIGKHVPKK